MPGIKNLNNQIRISYALRNVPEGSFIELVESSVKPRAGDIVVAEVVSICKNATLELRNGRRCSLHVGDQIGVVFGNRYATMQFEGYAASDGEYCDLLSMGGLCGIVESRHSKIPEPTKLRLIGAAAEHAGVPLRLSNYRLPREREVKPGSRVTVVCGTAMDSGKTHTALSTIVGLRQSGRRVAGIKLTGTASGRDRWSMLDAGAFPALDFVDGGLPSTFLCSRAELLDLYYLLLSSVNAKGVDCTVIEIADGLLQAETAALIQDLHLSGTVADWILAAGEPIAALGGVNLLRSWGISPFAVSGVLTMSPLNRRETELATGVRCFTALQLQDESIAAYLASSLEGANCLGIR